MNKFYIILNTGAGVNLHKHFSGSIDVTAPKAEFLPLIKSEKAYPLLKVNSVSDPEEQIKLIRDGQLSFLNTLGTIAATCSLDSLDNIDIIKRSRIFTAMKLASKASGPYFVRCANGSLMLCCDSVPVTNLQELKAVNRDVIGCCCSVNLEEYKGDIFEDVKTLEGETEFISTAKYFETLCQMRIDFPEKQEKISFPDFKAIESHIKLTNDAVFVSNVKSCEDGSNDKIIRVFVKDGKRENNCCLYTEGAAFSFTIGRNSFKTFRVTPTIVRDTDTLEGIAPFDEMLE